MIHRPGRHLTRQVGNPAGEEQPGNAQRCYVIAVACPARLSCGLGTIAQLRHTFLFGAMGTAKDRAVFFNPVADDVRATMRASRCEGLNCTFKAVKGVGAAIQCDLERLVVVIAASFACWHGCIAREN